MKIAIQTLGFVFATVLLTSTAFAQAAAAPATTPQAMEKLVAPIALYPDALVIQILQCSASPYQVKQVSTWLKENPTLKGTAAQDAATKQGYDASFVAIVLFPDVVHMMADKQQWTQELGQAFTTNRDGLLGAVQKLRKQAQAAGNLKTNDQQKVETVKTDSGDTVVVIQPANPQVVYVPQYDPQVVYVQSTTTTATSSNDGREGAAAIIGFAVGVIVGAAADDDDHHYYYSYGGWGYARPVCHPAGYDDFYEHREKMAKDYYEHRENMLKQRGENQSGRQGSRTENQGTRQESMTENQSSRQSAVGQSEVAQPTQTASSRGALQDSPRASGQTDGSTSGAFSNYQRGSTERESSSRGRASLSGASGEGRSGGRKR